MGDLKHSDHSFVKKKKHFFSSTQKHTASVKGSREDGGEKKPKRLFFRTKKNEDRAEKEENRKKKDRKYSISLTLSQLALSPLNSRYLFLTEKIKRVSQEKKKKKYTTLKI